MPVLSNVTTALFVLDGTAPASAEAEAASRLFPLSVHWTVLSSIRDHPAHTSGATGFASDVLSPEEMETRSRADRVEADASIAATARGLGDRPVRQLTERGDVAHAVTEFLRDEPCDVVVVASSELGEHLVDGGVHRVLVVPPSDSDAIGPVLVAVDDSPTDDDLMSTIAALVGTGAECVAVHITPIPPTTSASGAVGAAPAGRYDDLGEAAEQSAEDAIEQVRLRDVTPVGGVGSPVGGILEAAEEHGAALIVLGTRDRGWLSRLLRPSVSDAVLQRAQRPVLVVSSRSGPDTP